MTNRSAVRIALTSLLCGTSLLGIATTAQASSVLFSTDPGLAGKDIAANREIAVDHGTTQITLDTGAIASFVDAARFAVRPDGSVDLHSGTMTIVRSGAGQTKVYLPDGVEGAVDGKDSSASFTTLAKGGRGSVISGELSLTANGVTKQFKAGSFWSASADHAPALIVANAPALVPDAGTSAGTVQPMREGGIVAVASNGIPVTLGEGLAAAGVTGDILAAGKRLDMFDRNPSMTTFPTGDYALLTSYAAQAAAPFGAPAFRGAGSDIVLAYFQYLASGKAGSDFRSDYARFLLGYLDLVRSGALPSSFSGPTQSQLSAYIAYAGRSDGFGDLSAINRTLLDAYLAFLSTGGTADGFAPNARALVGSYFDYIRGGGDPAKFTMASAAIVQQYIAILQSGGIKTQLSGANQALLDAYYASFVKTGNGLDFATSEGTALIAFKTYLDAGGLPSGYTALDVPTLRAYLEKLSSTGLFDSFLGSQAIFLRSYLSYLQGGGTVDGFESLPINVLTRQANALNSYYQYIQNGGTPSLYKLLSQAQIVDYLAALQNAGFSVKLLGANAGFLIDYYKYLLTGANPDIYSGLPNLNFPLYASQLASFSAYLRAGNLPSGYSALTAQQIQAYLNALNASGHFTLLGTDSAFLGAYFAYLTAGGSPDAYAGLPIVTYRSYATALNAYYAFLNKGGLPSGYTALSQADLVAYINALQANGQLVSLLGSNSGFLAAYLSYLQNGGSADGFTSLPIFTYRNYADALNAYYAFLAKGGTPSAYTGLSQADILAYLTALKNAGQLDALLAANATFLANYLAYLQSGGAADKYASLPIFTFQSYAAALNAYYLFLAGGGKPSAYTALSQADILAYLAALKSAGQFAALLGGNAGYLDAYLAYINSGGTPDQYPALAVNQLRAANYAGGYATIGTKSGPAAVSQVGIVAVEVDSNGYPVTFGGTTHVGTATLADNSSTTDYVIGRYTNGTLTDTSHGAATTLKTLGANDSLQFAMATALPTTLPTSGIVTMGIAAATTPSFSDSSAVSGSSLTGGVAIAFGTVPKFGIAGILKLTDAGTAEQYNFTSAGGLAAPSLGVSVSGAQLAFADTVAVSTTDTRCTVASACVLTTNLALGGTTANVVAGTYTIGNANLTINGALVATAATAVGAIPVVVPPPPTPKVLSDANVFVPIAPAKGYGFSYGNPSSSGGTVVFIDGKPNQLYDPSYSYVPYSLQNSADNVEVGGDQYLVIGRWTNGMIYQGNQTQTLSVNEGLPYVVYTPAIDIPKSGTVDYSIFAKTAVTRRSKTLLPGVFDAKMRVAFGTDGSQSARIAVLGTLVMPDAGSTVTTYSFGDQATYDSAAKYGALVYVNGPLSFVESIARTAGTGVLNQDLCPDQATCKIRFFGGASGPQAVRFGFVYSTDAQMGRSLVGGIATGAVIFGADGTFVPGTVPPPKALPGDAPTGINMSVASTGIGVSLSSTTGYATGGAATGYYVSASPSAQFGGFSGNGGSAVGRGTATDHENGSASGIIGWTRWAGGTVDSGNPQKLEANGGASLVWGQDATALPTTGRVSYVMVGATAPTAQDASLTPGTVSSAALAVDFGTKKVGVEVGFTIDGANYAINSVGGVAAPSMDYTSGQFNGSNTNAKGVAKFNGFLAGAGASHAGVAYSFQPAGVPSLTAPLVGVVAFAKKP